MGVTDFDNTEETLSSGNASVSSTDFRDSSEINESSVQMKQSNASFNNLSDSKGESNRPNGIVVENDDKDDTRAELVPMLKVNGEDIEANGITEDETSESGSVPIDRGWAWMILLGMLIIQNSYTFFMA